MSAAVQTTWRGEALVTPAMQDYLKAVYRLRNETGPVMTQRLADELRLSRPSVTNMVKRLHDLGLLHHTRYRGVELTETGQQVALGVMHRHRLLERYLVDVLGFPWDEAHAEAECLEHYVSEKMEARIAVTLGHPTHDPHGDSIPSQDGAVTERRDRRLLDLEPGEGGVIVRVSDWDLEQLRYLGGLGLYPGVTVVVLEKMPFEGGLWLGVGDATHLLGLPLAAAVRVIGDAPAT